MTSDVSTADIGPDDVGPHANEPHEDSVGNRLNWLRAAVLGANDGIVSVAGIVMGIAGATADSQRRPCCARSCSQPSTFAASRTSSTRQPRTPTESTASPRNRSATATAATPTNPTTPKSTPTGTTTTKHRRHSTN